MSVNTQSRSVIGQFGPANTRPGAMTLVPDVAPEKVLVRGADGFTCTVIPGVLDDDAKEAFTSGQCVAFAAAYARRIGATRISLAIRTEDDSIIHAYVDGPEYGTMIDVHGTQYLDDYTRELDGEYLIACGECEECVNGDSCYDAECEYDFDVIDIEDVPGIASTRFGMGLPAQNWDLAETMMDPFTASLTG
jgi:hypothetical protein